MSHLEILYLAANSRSDLDQASEQEVIRHAVDRDARFTPITRATLHHLQGELCKNQYDLVHISAHGCESGIHLHDEGGETALIDHGVVADILTRAAPPRGKLRCAVLNTCSSSSIAEFEAMVPFTVAFTGKVADQTAIDFCRGFYTAAVTTADFAEAYAQGVIRARSHADGPLKAVLLQSKAGVLGVRSFLSDAEDLEQRTERLLALEHHFDRRSLRDSSSWAKVTELIHQFCARPELRQRMRENDFEVYLDAHSSIAISVGHCLGYGSPVYPLQGIGRLRRALWCPDPTRVPESNWELCKQIISEPSGPCELAISLSVTHSIKKDVSRYLARLGGAFHHVDLTPSQGPGRAAVEGADHAAYMAAEFVKKLRDLRQGEHRRRVHLFCACPNALAFFVGQHQHSLGPIQLYEFDFSNEAASTYSPSISLPIASSPTN